MSEEDIKLVNICYHALYKRFGRNIPDVLTERLNQELCIIINNGDADAYNLLWWILAHCTDVVCNDIDVAYNDRRVKRHTLILYLFQVTSVNPCHGFIECAHCGNIGYYGDYEYPDYCPVCGYSFDSWDVNVGYDLPLYNEETVDGHRAERILSIISDSIIESDRHCRLSDKDAYVLSRALSICYMRNEEDSIQKIVDYMILDKFLDNQLGEYK